MKLSIHKSLLLPCLLFVSACGGSGSDTATVESTTAITGSIFAGPLNGASVTVKNSSGATVAGPVTTGSDGTYSVNIPNSALSGDLVVEATGGTFPDEATGSTASGGTLSAHVSGGSLSAGTSVAVDPSSTIIRKLVAGGKTLTDAKSAFNTAFGYTPDTSVAPAFANLSTAAATDNRLAGLRAAVFSQLVKDLNLTPEKQFELLTALADDLSDGSLDGRNANGTVTTTSGTAVPEDIGNLFEKAFINFMASANNRTKLTADKIGALPFAKTVLTSTYKVTYVEGSMKAMQGKTTFKIVVKKRSDGSVAPGLTLTLAPKMYMATMSHVTPVDSVTDNGDGTYTCVVYYLMAGGPTMGYWDLKVSVNGETATFYPAVGMSMGDTTKVTLKHKDDKIPGMMGTTPRAYPVFKEALTADMGGTYTFKAFVTSQESMMSFPKLYTGIVLNSGTASQLTVNTLGVQASTDGTTWTAMTEDTVNKGHFTVSGLTGLSSGVQGKIYVRLTVNGNDYVDNATGDATAAGAHTYATFNVTPGGM